VFFYLWFLLIFFFGFFFVLCLGLVDFLVWLCCLPFCGFVFFLVVCFFFCFVLFGVGLFLGLWGWGWGVFGFVPNWVVFFCLPQFCEGVLGGVTPYSSVCGGARAKLCSATEG